MSVEDVNTLNATLTELLTRLENNKILGGSAEGVWARLVDAVSSEINDGAICIATTAASTSATTKDVLEDLQAFPASLLSDIEAISDVFQFSTLQDIATSVEMLLTSLQSAVQRPPTVFPRLACGDIPIDPARLSNLRKRHLKVEKLNADDPGLQESDRSMPNAPKSGMDVITNVTSSLETFADDVLVSAGSVGKLSANLQDLQRKAKELEFAREPVAGLFEKQEAVRDLISKVSSAFEKDQELPARARRDTGKTASGGNPLDIVKDTMVIVGKMKDTAGSMDGIVENLQGVLESFATMASQLREFFKTAVERLSTFIESLKRLAANLPRITRELQQFFVPTGLRTLLLRPSEALLSILESIEDIKKCLSNPENSAASAVRKISSGESVERVERIKSKIEEVRALPRKLYGVVEEQDLQNKILSAVDAEVSNLLSELGSSAVTGAVTEVLETFGVAPLTSQIGQQADQCSKDEESGGQASGWGTSLPWGSGKLFG